jgi:flagellar protein FliS
VENVYLKNRVLAADPVELIHLLYEHAILQVGAARTALAAGDIVGRSKAVSKILAILGELEGSLDHSNGGTISQNLAALYQYMRQRVVDANLKQDAAPLMEIESLLHTLDEGWTAIRHPESPQPTEEPVRMVAKGAAAGRFAEQAEKEPASRSWDA